MRGNVLRCAAFTAASVLVAASVGAQNAVPARAQNAAQDAPARICNTVKAKLAAGERVVGGTVTTPDPEIYCAMANAGEASRYLGGPQAWVDRDGVAFFQGPSDTALVRMGIERSLAAAPLGIAPIEGEEH